MTRRLALFFGTGEGERGQAVVLIGVMMTAMLMVVGLAVDAGQLYVARRTMQEAADAGAYAGAVVIYHGGNSAQAVAAAVTDVTSNGYVNGGDGGLTFVTVNHPPSGGAYAGDVKYVEVIVGTQVRTALLPAQSQLNHVRVRGVAGAEPLNNGYAIMALDRGNTPDAMNVELGGNVSVSGAGILVNSTSTVAADNQGTGNVTVVAPYGTDVAGGVEGDWPSPTTGAPQRPDPFAGYPKPNTDGMTVCTSLTTPPCGSQSGSTITINPGIYTVPIQAAGGTTIVLNTGIYIVKAGINGSGNADLNSGAGGVFIFNTTMNYPDSGGTCASIKLAGNASSSLAPLTTGTYAGLLFYQDPACTAEFVIAGNGVLSASGTIYLPTAAFRMDGNNATLTGSQLVAKTVNIQNGDISISFNSGTTAQPVLPRLSE
jgi:hypothetical protein